ncbi:hypothetical protein [Rhizobium sp. PAMB 3182]
MRNILRATRLAIPVAAFAALASSTASAADLGVSVSLGRSTSANVGASIGGGSGVSANADANVGGTSANVDASVGGGNGINAKAAVQSGGLGLDADVGIGGGSGGNSGSGAGSSSGNQGYRVLISDMSSGQAAVYRKRCVGILAQPAAYDTDLVGLCRALKSFKR